MIRALLAWVFIICGCRHFDRHGNRCGDHNGTHPCTECPKTRNTVLGTFRNVDEACPLRQAIIEDPGKVIIRHPASPGWVIGVGKGTSSDSHGALFDGIDGEEVGFVVHLWVLIKKEVELLSYACQFLSELWGRALTPLQLFCRQSGCQVFGQSRCPKKFIN